MTLTRPALTTLLLLTTFIATATDSSDALLERLTTAHRQIATISGLLTQRTTRSDDAGAEPRVLKATFAVQFPDRYDLVFTRPDDEEWRQRLCCDGERRWMIEQSFRGTPPDQTVTRVGDNDLELKRLFACLRMDLPILQKDYEVKADTLDERIRVVLTPKAPAQQPGPRPDQLTATFDASNHLRQLVMIDGHGNRTEAVIDQADYDRPLPTERFRGPDER